MIVSANLAAVLYTVSAVLFILALRGLSSPETSRRGNTFGMIGIAIAIVTTLLVSGMSGFGLLLSIGGLAIGGAIGAVIAKKIPMTDMPQLVAAFHSLVGLAAVFRHTLADGPLQVFRVRSRLSLYTRVFQV